MLSRWIAPALMAVAIAAPALAEDSGAFVQGRIELPDITLIDQNFQPYPLQGDASQEPLMVMTFSYTTCESICPIGNGIMSELDADLAQVGGQDVRLISVTIDPTTDTPALMAKAARDFDASPRWYWLTGHPGDIRRLLQTVGAPLRGLEFHDPIFLVGDPASGQFYRTQTLPTADELKAMLESIAG